MDREQTAPSEQRNEQAEKTPQVKKRLSTVKLGTVIRWAVILILFLWITNPGLIPFLPQSARDSVRGTWQRIFGDVGKIADTFVLNWATVFQVIAIILMMILATALLRFIVQHIHAKNPKTRSFLTLINSALSYLTAIIGFFWCLSTLGVNLTAILASVGVLALIIGFGAQSLVEDLVTGVFLVFEDEFNVGDIIEAGGFRGTVESIGIRVTCLRDLGGNVKIINNSDLRNILNRSSQASWAATTVSVAYGTKIDELETKLAEFLPEIQQKYPEIFLEDPKYSGVQELADSGIVLKFGGAVDEKNIYAAPRILNRELLVFFDRVGVQIPFPQVVVHRSEE
ncbi:small conductance mechanosensitive channel [Ruminococcaceae bacterium YRB3002]|nr:small conductance mechanosensitive channel [Ruminococcaceae bacterium YRB3002]